MKTALCLHGHFRTFDHCWTSIKERIIDPYQPDVFAASWMDSMGIFQHPEATENPRNHPGYNLNSASVSIDYVNSVLDRIKPVDLHLDHYYLHNKKFDQMLIDLDAWHHPSIHHRPKGALSSAYMRGVSVALKREHEKRQGIKYDRVITTRWDININSPIEIAEFDPNLLTVPNWFGPDVLTDVLACSSSELMDVWCSQFDNIQALVDVGTFNLGPHEWTKAWCEYNNLKWQGLSSIDVTAIR